MIIMAKTRDNVCKNEIISVSVRKYANKNPNMNRIIYYFEQNPEP